MQDRNDTLEHFHDPAAVAVKCDWRSFSKDSDDRFNRVAIHELLGERVVDQYDPRLPFVVLQRRL